MWTFDNLSHVLTFGHFYKLQSCCGKMAQNCQKAPKRAHNVEELIEPCTRVPCSTTRYHTSTTRDNTSTDSTGLGTSTNSTTRDHTSTDSTGLVLLGILLVLIVLD